MNVVIFDKNRISDHFLVHWIRCNEDRKLTVLLAFKLEQIDDLKVT